MSSKKYNFTYKQLFCDIETRIQEYNGSEKDRGNFDISRLSKFPDDPSLSQCMCFGNNTIFYLCEYISRNKDHEHNKFVDKRSSDFVLAFKSYCTDDILNYIAAILSRYLPDNCALMAVPPSKVKKNGKTTVHALIHKIVNIAGSKHIIDASDCLVRSIDTESAHKSDNKRDVAHHLETIDAVNLDKIDGKMVLILDDITTSGTSFEACRQKLEEHEKIHPQSITYFAVGRTLDISHMKPGFILDIDGTLFDSETGEIKVARDRQNWERAKSLARNLRPVPGAKELIKYIELIGARYYLVTTSPGSYAQILAAKLGVSGKHIISFHDTKKHKPDTQPYLLAKQKMKIYEPFIIAIGNQDTDMIPANRLGMTSVLIGNNKNNVSTDFTFTSIAECLRRLPEIGKKIELNAWQKFANAVQQDNLENFNKSLYRLINRTPPEISVAQKVKKIDIPKKECHPTNNGFIYSLVFSDLQKISTHSLNVYRDNIFSITSVDEALEQYHRIRKDIGNRTWENLSSKEFSIKIDAAKKDILESTNDGIQVATYLDSCCSRFINSPTFRKGDSYRPFFFYEGDVSLLTSPSIAILSTDFHNQDIRRWSSYFISQVNREGWTIVIRLQNEFGQFCLDFCRHRKYKCIVISDLSIDRVDSDIREAVSNLGGCIISMNHKYYWNRSISSELHDRLQIDLANAVYAFGYSCVPEDTEGFMEDFYHPSKKKYYNVLINSEKPVCCYKGNFRELKELPILRINKALVKFVPGARELLTNNDIRQFLNAYR